MNNKFTSGLFVTVGFIVGCAAVLLYFKNVAEYAQDVLSFLEVFTKIGVIGGGIVAFIFAFWRATLQDRQTCVSERKLFTDRFAEASKKLESKNEHIRIAAIILLRSTGMESANQSDKHSTLDVLSSFVRLNNAHKPNYDDENEDNFEDRVCAFPERFLVKEDALVAIRSIAILSAQLSKTTSYKINLSEITINCLSAENCTLNCVNLCSSRLLRQFLMNVTITSSNLIQFRMIDGILNNCRIEDTNLNGVYFKNCIIEDFNFNKKADLEGSHFLYSTLIRGEFLESNLKYCNFTGGSIQGTIFYKTNMTDCRFRNVKMENVVFESAYIEEKSDGQISRVPFTRENVPDNNELKDVTFL